MIAEQIDALVHLLFACALLFRYKVFDREGKEWGAVCYSCLLCSLFVLTLLLPRFSITLFILFCSWAKNSESVDFHDSQMTCEEACCVHVYSQSGMCVFRDSSQTSVSGWMRTSEKIDQKRKRSLVSVSSSSTVCVTHQLRFKNILVYATTAIPLVYEAAITCSRIIIKIIVFNYCDTSLFFRLKELHYFLYSKLQWAKKENVFSDWGQ